MADKTVKPVTEEYLMTVSNDIELSIVEGILEAEGIPFIKRYLEAGDLTKVYIGFSRFGIEIYVSNEDLERAKEAVGNMPQTSYNEG